MIESRPPPVAVCAYALEINTNASEKINYKVRSCERVALRTAPAHENRITNKYRRHCSVRLYMRATLKNTSFKVKALR